MSAGRTVTALALVVGAALAHAAAAGEPAPPATIPVRAPLALDHVSVVVRDLEAAARRFERLGFVVKPGRLHPNSIDNRHVEFADGTEIELITATAPRDTLAWEYARMRRGHDGGGFAALRTTALDDLVEHLARIDAPVRRGEGGTRDASFPHAHPLRGLWFLEASGPDVNAPEWTAHPNGAARLEAVWLAPGVQDLAATVLERLGWTGFPRSTPAAGARAFPLDRGEVIVVDARVPAGDRLVRGATVAAPSLERLIARLRAEGVRWFRRRDARGVSVLLPPEEACGIWLEFLERPGRREGGARGRPRAPRGRSRGVPPRPTPPGSASGARARSARRPRATARPARG